MSKLLLTGILQQAKNQSGGEPPSGGWDYEGLITVGSLYGFYTGWIKNSMGSINPSSPQVSGFNITNGIYMENMGYILHVEDSGGNQCMNTISINGIEYQASNLIGGTTIELYPNNPFPAVGQTCTIKLK